MKKALGNIQLVMLSGLRTYQQRRDCLVLHCFSPPMLRIGLSPGYLSAFFLSFTSFSFSLTSSFVSLPSPPRCLPSSVSSLPSHGAPAVATRKGRLDLSLFISSPSSYSSSSLSSSLKLALLLLFDFPSPDCFLHGVYLSSLSFCFVV